MNQSSLPVELLLPGRRVLVTGGGTNMTSAGIVASITGGANTDGTVLKVAVLDGDAVAEGDLLLVVEAIYRREMWPWALLGVTSGLVEGATVSVLMLRLAGATLAAASAWALSRDAEEDAKYSIYEIQLEAPQAGKAGRPQRIWVICTPALWVPATSSRWCTTASNMA